MDINKFAKKPEMIQITLDDAEIIENYGEAITFWMKDFVDINTYFDFFKSQGTGGNELNTLMAKIILKEDGTPAIGEGEALPVDIAVAALTKINDTLGKSKTKSSTKKSGKQPE